MKKLFSVITLVLMLTVTTANAALCVMADNNGRLLVSGDTITECTGYVVLDAYEFASVPTLQSLFAYPETEDVVKAWMAGFTLPLVLYLSAWGLGTVINFFNPEYED